MSAITVTSGLWLACTVQDTDPVLRGVSAQETNKSAVTASGLKLKVRPFNWAVVCIVASAQQLWLRCTAWLLAVADSGGCCCCCWLQVPVFVEKGDKIIVSTKDGTYMERVK